MAPSTKTLLNLFLVTLIVSISACQKKSGDSPSVSSEYKQHEILKSIPSLASGFFVLDLESAAYQEHRKSDWASGSVDFIKKVSTADSSGTTTSMLDLTDSLLNDVNTNISAVAGFINNISSQNDFSVGLILRAKSASDRNTFLTSMTKQLATKSIKISAASEISATAQSLELDTKNHIFFDSINTADILVVTNKELIKASQTAAPDTKGIDHLLNSQSYKLGRSELNTKKGEYFYGYWDLSSVRKNIQKMITDSGKDKELDFPFVSVSLSQGMDQGPYGLAVLETDTNLPELAKFSKSLTNIGNLAALQNLPSSSVLALGINGKAVRNLMDNFAEQIPTNAANEMNTKQLKDIGYALLAVQGVPAGSMFPSMTLTVHSSRAPALKADLQKVAADLLAAQLGGKLPWQSKKIGALDVDYVITPLGVGMYLAEAGDVLHVSSSETGISDLINAASGQATTLKSAVPAFVNQDSQANDGIFQLVLRFDQIADLIQQVSGSLGMFTGGEPPMQQAELDQLKKLGTLNIAARSSGNLIIINQSSGKVG